MRAKTHPGSTVAFVFPNDSALAEFRMHQLDGLFPMRKPGEFRSFRIPNGSRVVLASSGTHLLGLFLHAWCAPLGVGSIEPLFAAELDRMLLRTTEEPKQRAGAALSKTLCAGCTNRIAFPETEPGAG